MNIRKRRGYDIRRRKAPVLPIPRKENAEIYAQYKALADARTDVHFVGRLATYKYYNMDQIVAQALTEYGKILGMKRKAATVFKAKKEKFAVPLAVVPSINGNGKAASTNLS